MWVRLKAQEPTFFSKPMAPAVPTYAISVFKVPLNLCEDIQKATAQVLVGLHKR